MVEGEGHNDANTHQKMEKDPLLGVGLYTA